MNDCVIEVIVSGAMSSARLSSYESPPPNAQRNIKKIAAVITIATMVCVIQKLVDLNGFFFQLAILNPSNINRKELIYGIINVSSRFAIPTHHIAAIAI